VSELLLIKLIKQDSRLQPRAKMDTAIIDEYTESMKRGDSFPAVVVFKVGEDYFLVDGYHRYLAVQGAKFDKILADVRIGTMRDAVLFSAGVNATHGIRRTNEDKRRAVLTLLRDKEWKDWADTKIAATCNVSVDLVATVRKASLGETDSHRRTIRKVERAGKVVKMDTSKIGKKKSDPVKNPETPAPEMVKIHCPLCGWSQTIEKEMWDFQSSSEGHGYTCGSGKCPTHTYMILDGQDAAPQVQPPLSALMTGTVPPEPPIHRPPPCLGGGGCTRGKFIPRVSKDSIKGDVCNAIGVEIAQLPGNMCPYDVKLARKSGGAFVPASGDLSVLAAKPAKLDRTLTIAFSPDQWAILGKLQKAGVADGYDGAVLFCVDEIGNRSA
jgi:hypothetical protein